MDPRMLPWVRALLFAVALALHGAAAASAAAASAGAAGAAAQMLSRLLIQDHSSDDQHNNTQEEQTDEDRSKIGRQPCKHKTSSFHTYLSPTPV